MCAKYIYESMAKSHRRTCVQTAPSAHGAAPTVKAGMPSDIAKKLMKLRQVGLASAWKKQQGTRDTHSGYIYGIGFCKRWRKDYVGTAQLKPMLQD